MKPEPNELDDDMVRALLAWRADHGRYWKHELAKAWLNGQDEHYRLGQSLRRVRNTCGPTWLADLTSRELDTIAAAHGVPLRN